MIGDRALEQRKKSTFIYDLGSEWRAITGLPFVFAAWISLRPLSEDFIRAFDAANGLGISLIDDIVANIDYSTYDLRKYYKLHLSYELDERKREGLQKFLSVLSSNG